MRTITLKSVPDALYDTLKEAARQNRRSLNQETLRRIEQSVGTQPQRDPEAILRSIHEMQQTIQLPALTDEFINAAKRMGRP